MIDRVLNNNTCAGCGLCQSVFTKEKVSISLDKQGFYRPNINKRLSTKEEDILSKFCPGVIVKKSNIIDVAPNKDVLWGDMFSCIIGRSTDETIVKEASSGGAISALLSFLLETKKVEAILHIGVSEGDPCINELKISTNKQQIIKNAGSRYSPSTPLIDILNNIHEFDSYAFVGKPCDIAALRQYAQINHTLKDKIKYYISFFCAGVPSFKATTDIVSAMDIRINDVKSLYYRKDGWPGYFKVTDKNNSIHKLSYSLTWMHLLGPKVQFRCKICADGIGHLSDIVCADAWDDYNDKGFPTFKNALGKSLIISRTKVGEELLQAALINKYLEYIKMITDYRIIDKMQPGQYSKKIYYLPRSLALLLKKGYSLKFEKDFYLKATLKLTPIKFLRNWMGALKRLN